MKLKKKKKKNLLKKFFFKMLIFLEYISICYMGLLFESFYYMVL